MAAKTNFKLEDFTSFWKHYELVQQWIDVNQQARDSAIHNLELEHAKDEVNALFNRMNWGKAKAMTNAMLTASTSKNNDFEKEIFKRKISESTNDEKKKSKKKKRRTRHRKSTSTTIDVVPDDIVDIEIDMEDLEMDDEMVEFFRISMEHRQNRETQKMLEWTEKQRENAGHWIKLDENAYIMDTDIGVFKTKQTFDTPDLQSEQDIHRIEMQKKYGEDFEKIMAMEASLEIRFQQHYDKYAPNLWPSIPFRF